MKLFPVNVVRNRLALLLAGDATTFAPADDPNKLTLVKGDMTLDPALTAANFADRLVTTNGLAPIEGIEGAQLESIDPATMDRKVDIKEPLGGYRWETTSAPTDPIQVTGAILTNNDGTVLLGIVVLDPPVTLTDTNQSINIGNVDLPIPQTAFGV